MLGGVKGEWVSGDKVTKNLSGNQMVPRFTLDCQCAFLCPGKYHRKKLAARLGVEPRQNESESFVLPLHHRAVTIAGALQLNGFAHHRRKTGAGDGIRTRNRLFTKQVLYR